MVVVVVVVVVVQAKDNVKYLATLDKFIEPLRSTNLMTVTDALPALLNSIKMVHTIARYYSTTERMTTLFVKVSNQVALLVVHTGPTLVQPYPPTPLLCLPLIAHGFVALPLFTRHQTAADIELQELCPGGQARPVDLGPGPPQAHDQPECVHPLEHSLPGAVRPDQGQAPGHAQGQAV